MADGSIVNQVRTTTGLFWYDLLLMLTAAGWVVKASGDGLAAYSSTTTVFSGGGASGANGFANSGAWVRLQDPGGVREFVLQHNNSTGIRLKISPAAKFTGGSGSATRVPSATDEQVPEGSGTDASPTYVTFLASVTGGTIKSHGFASGASPYGWWMGAKTIGSTTTMQIVWDPVNGNAADTDKLVYTFRGNGGNPWTGANMSSPTDTLNSSSAYCFWDTALTVFLGAPYAGYITNSVSQYGSGGAVNPFDPTEHTLLPIRVNRNSALATKQGQKGWSTVMRWTATSLTTAVQMTTDKLWVVYGDVWVPWNGVDTITA